MTRYAQGWPSWVDLATADVGWMLTFYHSLFGWTDRVQSREGAPDYHLQHHGEAPLAAIYQQPREESRNGVPPYWSTHLTVADVDATTGQVAGVGGTVLEPPVDVGAAGRMSVVADPGGAAVRLWQGQQHLGAGVIREPGAMSWCELQTGDPDRAAAFLQALLGTELRVQETAGGAPYTLIEVDGEPVAGIRRIPQYLAPHWVAYFEVDDLDATIETAAAKGGSVLSGPADGVRGRFATLQDPQGAVFGLLRSGSSS